MENSEIIVVGNVKFPPRKVWIKTFGCQMNYHDTERILSHLKALNFSQTSDKDEADLVLFNTCAIRDLANLKFYSQLGEIKHIKNRKNELVVGVGGCIGQSEGEELVKKYRHLDFAFGTDSLDQIVDMVYRTYAGDSKFVINMWDKSADYSIETKITHKSPQAFVNIIKGCNNFCSYCIVPYTRGREKSRRKQEIVDDVKKLVEYQGIQEITLLGQNVNSFGKEHNETLAELIMDLDSVNGLELLRYTTSHPKDLSDELIAVHGSSKKLSKHLHLPVQSGSNTVLKRMLRNHTIEHYLGLIEKIKKVQPDIVLSSDIIVGFPNETEEEYQDTLNLLHKVQYDFVYAYQFSARGNTKAALMEDFLTHEVKRERLVNLQQVQLRIQEANRPKIIGDTMRVLVDGKSDKRGELKWSGRTNCNRLVHFLPENLDIDYKWNWIDLEITSATALSCQGKIIKNHGRRPQ